jgi:hypothetical protein
LVLSGEGGFETIPAKEPVPATDLIAAQLKFTEVCVFACPLAELVAPPTMRHQAETPAAMIADLGLPHDTLAQQFEGIPSRQQPAGQKMTLDNFSPTIASVANPLASEEF